MSYSKKSILIDGLFIFLVGILISNLGINNLFVEILCLSLVLIVIDIFRLKKRRRDNKSKLIDDNK